MGQITIHLDADSEAKARDCAKIMNTTLDQWISNLILEITSAIWPESVRKLAGSWPDFPSLGEIRAETGKEISY